MVAGKCLHDINKDAKTNEGWPLQAAHHYAFLMEEYISKYPFVHWSLGCISMQDLHDNERNTWSLISYSDLS